VDAVHKHIGSDNDLLSRSHAQDGRIVTDADLDAV
jgi:hypothetical protein